MKTVLIKDVISWSLSLLSLHGREFLPLSAIFTSITGKKSPIKCPGFFTLFIIYSRDDRAFLDCSVWFFCSLGPFAWDARIVQ